IWRAVVLSPLGRDRRRLDAEPARAHRLRRLVHDPVARRPAVLQRQVEPLEVERQLQHIGVQDAQGLLEQLLAGLVALQDSDAERIGHGARVRFGTPWTSAAGAVSRWTAT